MPVSTTSNEIVSVRKQVLGWSCGNRRAKRRVSRKKRRQKLRRKPAVKANVKAATTAKPARATKN